MASTLRVLALVLVSACAADGMLAVTADIKGVECEAWRADPAARAELSAALAVTASGAVQAVDYECTPGLAVMVEVEAADTPAAVMEEVRQRMLAQMLADPALVTAELAKVAAHNSSTCAIMGADFSIALSHDLCYPVHCNDGLFRERVAPPARYSCVHPANVPDAGVHSKREGYSMADGMIVLAVVAGVILALLVNFVGYQAYLRVHPEDGKEAADDKTVSSTSTPSKPGDAEAPVACVSLYASEAPSAAQTPRQQPRHVGQLG